MTPCDPKLTPCDPKLTLLIHDRFSGYGRNPSHPEWGSKYQPIRKINEATNSNKNFLSSTLTWQRIEEQNEFNSDDERLHPRNLSVFGVFYAKFITDEILDTKKSSCPVKMHTADGLNIPIFDGSTDKTTGTPVNLASAWLDGSVIYGISAEHESKLRTVLKFPILDANQCNSFVVLYQRALFQNRSSKAKMNLKKFSSFKRKMKHLRI